MFPEFCKPKAENIACQGASEAVRRRATLDTAEGARTEWQKRE